MWVKFWSYQTKLSLMRRFARALFAMFLFILISPLSTMAAEVLQVSSSSLLQIGDHNRIYTVRLACLEVDLSDEIDARNWLKSELPRRRRVNLRPEGTVDGILSARVIPIGSDKDLGEGLASVGLGRFACAPTEVRDDDQWQSK